MTCQIDKVGFRRFVDKFKSKKFLKIGTGKCVTQILSSATPPKLTSKNTTETESSPSEISRNPDNNLLTDAQLINADPGNK